jgi:hypothetical protein
MTKETSSLGLPRLTNYDQIAKEHGLRPSSELSRAFLSAYDLILENHLFAELLLDNVKEKEIFKLEIAERFLREELYVMENKKASRGLRGLRSKAIQVFGRAEKKRDEIYQAKEIIEAEKDKITKDMSEKDKKRAHVIGLAANDLFPVYQLSNGQSLRLKGDTIIGDIPLLEWSLSWQEKLRSITD